MATPTPKPRRYQVIIGKGPVQDPKEHIPLQLRSVTKWKQIPGWPDYFVSTDGRVFSSKSSKVLAPYLNQTGTYRIVKLHDGEGGSKQRSVHTLVLQTYKGDPGSDPLEVAHHKDGDPTNNHLSNLEWVTPEQNEDAKEIEDDGPLSTIDAAPF